MPEMFVNPAPGMTVQRFLSFDFPCKDPGEGVELPGPPGGYRSTGGAYGNVNLHAPGIEQLYGPFGVPALEQGHPFMKELPAEAEDPATLDLVLDIDQKIQINHTGRLSGSLVRLLASKPQFSTIEASALAVAPVDPTTSSIVLFSRSDWLTPQPEAPNVWFWLAGSTSHELLYTVHAVIDPRALDFDPEATYKLVMRWKFWRYTGTPIPAAPPATDDPKVERLPISGFDEAIAFEVIRATVSV